MATVRPDAFVPDLAASLNNVANMLSDLGRREKALAAAEEAVKALAPSFQAAPYAFDRWMRVICTNWRPPLCLSQRKRG